MIIRNSRGRFFRNAIGGCYPVNDGDPQNDDPEFDEDEMNDRLDMAEEEEADRNG